MSLGTDWTFSQVWETVARIQPDRPAIAQGARRVSWGELDERSAGLARTLVGAGLSHQGKVAQYLYNAPEYVETVFATFRAAGVPVNTNYRYADAELVYLWTDAEVEAVVFHGSFVERVEAVRSQLPRIRTWVWVDDGAAACPPWAIPYEDAVRPDEGADGGTALPAVSGDDLYLLYTGGTTGMPKGVMWRQDDLFVVLNRTAMLKYPEDGSVADVPAGLAAADPDRAVRVVPCAPMMHGTSSFAAFAAMQSGGEVVFLENRSFDAVELLDTIQAERITDLAIVGDVFAQPIVRELDAAPGRWDISSLRVILSSGVMWSAPVKEGIIRHAPDVLCVDTLGSSEALGLGRSVSSSRRMAKTAGFKLGEHARIIDEDNESVVPGSGQVGRVAVQGRAPIGYYRDEEKTARTFPIIDGERWVIPGDLATVEADGTVRLLGRGSACINTGGEKVFPEEVEETLKLHPKVLDAIVVGLPDDRFGEVVVGVVELDPAAGDVPGDELDLRAFVKEHLAGYKAPKHVLVVDSIGRAANGKLDHRRWRAEVAETLS
jgi:acyl-CoA synthetase (AMP-forming)/AMP-acid ligase II